MCVFLERTGDRTDGTDTGCTLGEPLRALTAARRSRVRGGRRALIRLHRPAPAPQNLPAQARHRSSHPHRTRAARLPLHQHHALAAVATLHRSPRAARLCLHYAPPHTTMTSTSSSCYAKYGATREARDSYGENAASLAQPIHFGSRSGGRASARWLTVRSSRIGSGCRSRPDRADALGSGEGSVPPASVMRRCGKARSPDCG